MSDSAGHKIGFVGARFAGTDGVSLEASKWAKVLWHHRHISYWFAGRLNTDPSVSFLEPHAYFGHPDIQWINDRIFGRVNRDKEVTRRIYALSEHLKRSLYDFVSRFDIDSAGCAKMLCASR